MDKVGSCATLLTYLIKVFECIVNDFLITKLKVYGLHKT